MCTESKRNKGSLTRSLTSGDSGTVVIPALLNLEIPREQIGVSGMSIACVIGKSLSSSSN